MPRKPTGQPRGRRPQRGSKATNRLVVLLTDDELERHVQAAVSEGVTLSEYVRRALDQHAAKGPPS